MELIQSFVQLPEASQLAITTLVVALVGLLFSFIGTKLPWTSPFLAKYQQEISLAAAAAVVGFVENALPSAYPEVSILVVQLLLAVLAAIGVFKVLSKAGVKGIRG